MSVYLNDWAKDGFFAMVGDFEGAYISKAEYEAEQPPYANVEYWAGKKAEMTAALADDKWRGVEVILATYSQEGYEGSAFVLFRKDGELYEVNGSHCSCYGLEDQWQPEATTVDAISHRLDKGHLGTDYDGNNFAAELRAALAGIA